MEKSASIHTFARAEYRYTNPLNYVFWSSQIVLAKLVLFEKDSFLELIISTMQITKSQYNYNWNPNIKKQLNPQL